MHNPTFGRFAHDVHIKKRILVSIVVKIMCQNELIIKSFIIVT